MKSSSFAIATAVFLAANCLGASSGAFALQHGNVDPTPCADSSAACAGQPVAGAATTPSTQAQPSLPVSQEKIAFHVLAEFSSGLDVKKLKPGDKVKASVSQDVLWHGRILVPEESKLVGHVTEVKRHGADDPESRLGLVFDRVLMKHHHELDFQGVVQALSPPAPRRSRVDEPDPMAPPVGVVATQGPTAMGNSPAGRGSTSSGPTRSLSTVASMPAGVPVSTATGPGNSGPGPMQRSGQPMSAGMPRGVFGIKGLTLSQGPSSSTPGAVILSKIGDVKLENGTQVLLEITGVTSAAQ